MPVRSLMNGRKSAYTTLHHRFAVSQCKWLFSSPARRYERNDKKEDKLLNVDDQKRCLNWPRRNKRMIHVPRDEIWEKRNKKGLVRVINENNNSLRCEKLCGSESHSRVTGNNLNSVSLVVIYRLNGPTAIDRALQVNSRTMRRPCKQWISCQTYRKTANDESVKVKTALKLLSTSFATGKIQRRLIFTVSPFCTQV